MKKKLLVGILIIALTVSLSSLVLFATQGEGDSTATPYSNCINHLFVREDDGVDNGMHHYRCSKCTHGMLEDCYIISCIGHDDFGYCSGCYAEEIRAPHDYELEYSGYKSHNYICNNQDYSGNICYDIKNGSIEDCEFEDRLMKTYVVGRGHVIYTTCAICKGILTFTYHDPAGHADGYDASCIFCTMSGYYLW